MVRVGVRKLHLHEQFQLIFSYLFSFSNVSVDDAFNFFAKSRVTSHLGNDKVSGVVVNFHLPERLYFDERGA